MTNRLKRIKEKGFSMLQEDTVSMPTDFSKIRVGLKTLEDSTINLATFDKIDSRLADKKKVLEAIKNYDLAMMREVSNFFYKTSGIYSRLCRYMAALYRYDWMVTPYIIDDSIKKDKILNGFTKVLIYLDDFKIKQILGEIALKVIRYGCYYGYVIENSSGVSIQELPYSYCRTRYSVNGIPAIEFNMKFFDDYYKDTVQRMKVLDLFPTEFKKGYILYKQGKLVYQMPSIKDRQAYCESEYQSLTERITDIKNPHTYYVDLSDKLRELKQYMLFDVMGQVAESGKQYRKVK